MLRKLGLERSRIYFQQNKMKTYPDDKDWAKARQGGINALSRKRFFLFWKHCKDIKDAEDTWDRWYANPPYLGCLPYINAAGWRAMEIEDREKRIEEMVEAARRVKKDRFDNK